jgi:hypothetical protein
MAQHDQVIDNAPGLAVRTDINAALAALFSSSSGPVEPVVKVPGQPWFDTSVGGQTKLWLRNQDNSAWLPIMTLSAAVNLGDLLIGNATGGFAALALGAALANLRVKADRSGLEWVASATALQWLANNPNALMLTPAAIWAGAAPVALTDAAPIVWDLSAGSNFAVTLNVAGGTRILSFPLNPKPGQTGWIDISQDGTGNRALTYAANIKFQNKTAPVLSTAAGAIDTLFYFVKAAADLRVSLTSNWG